MRQEEDIEIRFIKQTRHEWLKDLPKFIKEMVKVYGFYYADTVYPIRIHRSIEQLVLEKHQKNKHRFICYFREDINYYYLVMYCKKHIKIFCCNEYNNAGESANYAAMKRFMTKFSRAYQAGVEEHEQELLTSPMVNTRRV